MAAPGLQRRLGTGDAIVLGLASMIGAGVFAVYAPAARVAGTGLMLGLAVAAVIAYANAAASAQLAAVYPTSGGTYVFGRERLGEWWGFTAGWAFVVGKTASCAAMALTFAAYVVPAPGWTQRLVALGAVLALGATNYRGIIRTARLSRVLVAVTLASLAAILLGTWLAPGPLQPLTWSLPGGAYGVLQAAGLLFFAFAGYARIATLGEEVRDPRRTIGKAILGALAIVVVLYAIVGWTALAAAGPQRLAASSAPLTEVVLAAGALRAHGVDLEIVIVDFDVDIFHLGQHRDGGGRGVDAAGGFGVGHALHTVHAGFEFELGEDAAAAHLGDDFLEAALAAFAD